VTAQKPICYVIAGPNGAGKTTFAMWYLPRVTDCVEFVNADSIARGLSPLNEQMAQIKAGRLFLNRIREMESCRKSFAFETTLSGRWYGLFLKDLIKSGYRIELNYLWIPSAEFSARRVAARVEDGGHDIPPDAIARRYAKSMHNLSSLYLPLVDYAAVWDNSNELPRLIYEQCENGGVIFDDEIWCRIKEFQQ